MADRLYHRKADWMPEGRHWRIIYGGKQKLGRLDRCDNGAWAFSLHWAGLDAHCTSSSLESAERTIRAIYDAFGAPKAGWSRRGPNE